MLYILRPDETKARDNLYLHLSKLHPNKTWDVEIKEHNTTRTSQQNRYMHKLCRVISEHTGYTVDEIKHRVVDALGYWEKFQTKSGKIKQTLKSTAKMDTKDIGEVIDALQEACQIMGLKYPLPSDLGYNI